MGFHLDWLIPQTEDTSPQSKDFAEAFSTVVPLGPEEQTILGVATFQLEISAPLRESLKYATWYPGFDPERRTAQIPCEVKFGKVDPEAHKRSMTFVWAEVEDSDFITKSHTAGLVAFRPYQLEVQIDSHSLSLPEYTSTSGNDSGTNIFEIGVEDVTDGHRIMLLKG